RDALRTSRRSMVHAAAHAVDGGVIPAIARVSRARRDPGRRVPRAGAAQRGGSRASDRRRQHPRRGHGKTPLTRALATALEQTGWHPGIVSRGYGGTASTPRSVAPGDDPTVVGDEPLLLAADALPVWIGRDRVAAVHALLAAHPECDVVLADDGLQHYALRRHFEIAVIDEVRGFGNAEMLPAGPLREPLSRLDRVDAVVRLIPGDVPPASQGDGRETTMTYEPLPWRNLARPDATADARAGRAGSLHAVAGIGEPERRFDLDR